jgi:hypothetical protein
MRESNVIPFRERSPSQRELEACQKMTRHWSNQMRQLMIPERYRADDPVRVPPNVAKGVGGPS